MKEIILDGNMLSNKEIAHDYLKKMLELPEYYGGNLDALYDCLTELQDVEITIYSKQQENIYFNRMICVFKEAANENDKIIVNMA